MLLMLLQLLLLAAARCERGIATLANGVIDLSRYRQMSTKAMIKITPELSSV
jgi:hypothetical protein